MRADRLALLGAEMCAGERERCHVGPAVVLALASHACRCCGCIVVMAGGVCVSCGAAGKSRTAHPGACVVWVEPAPAEVAS